MRAGRDSWQLPPRWVKTRRGRPVGGPPAGGWPRPWRSRPSTIGLFWAYLFQSRNSGANSDAAAQALQGWEVVHGHLLLRRLVPVRRVVLHLRGAAGRPDQPRGRAAERRDPHRRGRRVRAPGAVRRAGGGGRGSRPAARRARGVGPRADRRRDHGRAGHQPGRARAAAGTRPHRHRRPGADRAAGGGPAAARQAAAGARDRAAGLPAADLGAARRPGGRVQLRAAARPGLRHAAGGSRDPAAGRPRPAPGAAATRPRRRPGAARRSCTATTWRCWWRRSCRSA